MYRSRCIYRYRHVCVYSCRCVWAQVCADVCAAACRFVQVCEGVYTGAGTSVCMCVHVCEVVGACRRVQVCAGTGVYTCAGQMCVGACSRGAQEELLLSAPAVLAGVLPVGSVVPPFVELK